LLPDAICSDTPEMPAVAAGLPLAHCAGNPPSGLDCGGLQIFAADSEAFFLT